MTQPHASMSVVVAPFNSKSSALKIDDSCFEHSGRMSSKSLGSISLFSESGVASTQCNVAHNIAAFRQLFAMDKKASKNVVGYTVVSPSKFVMP